VNKDICKEVCKVCCNTRASKRSTLTWVAMDDVIWEQGHINCPNMGYIHRSEIDLNYCRYKLEQLMKQGENNEQD
jgi:hypothetical protein